METTTATATTTFTPDTNGYAETLISKYNMTPLSAKVIRNYQQAIFNYEMAKREGDYTLADRYAKIANANTPVKYYNSVGWNWSGGQKIHQSTVTRLREEVLNAIRKMEVK